MLDRQDLDALLIGALYGELTPAETARLAQHLESHPADKVALDDMTRARKAVQDSRIFASASMADPPQAVSALLLQEAHRRAPVRPRATTSSENVGWFQRFLKTFVAHPAMAAATMLVLVVGVAGTIYIKNGQIGADETVSRSGGANDIPPTINARVSVDTTRGDELQKNVDPNAAVGNAGYVAQLDESGLGGKDKQQAATPTVTPAELKPDNGQLAAAWQAKPSAPSGTSTPSGINGVEVHHAGPTVKELPSDRDLDQTVTLATDAPAAPTPHFAAPAKAPAPPIAAPEGAATGAAGGGAVAGNMSDNAPAPAPAQAPPPPPPRAEPKPHSQPPQSPPPADARRLEKKGENAQENANSTNSKDDSAASLQAWAEQQHKRLVALVQQDNCSGAADLAVTLQARAPDYFNQNVANDRAVSHCFAYISQRQADERQKRAAAAKAKAADEPAATKH